MGFILLIIMILFLILGTIYLRKNTQKSDKVGLIFFIFSFEIVCLMLIPFEITTLDFNFRFSTFSNPFEKKEPKTSESSFEMEETQMSDIEKKDDGEKTYVIGKDIPEGEYLLPEHGNSSMTFKVIDTKTYAEVYSSDTSGADSFLDLKKVWY